MSYWLQCAGADDVFFGIVFIMESAKAMRRFLQFNLWPDVKLELVHFGGEGKGSDTLLEDAAAYCKDHGFQVGRHVISGKASDRLLDIAVETDADMNVMGYSLRSKWLRKMLGDKAPDTLTRADRPLFLSR